MARLRPRFASVGCNRVVHALDWGAAGGGLIAYGGASAVCIYDPEADRLLAALPGHAGRVNCVRWIPAAAGGGGGGDGSGDASATKAAGYRLLASGGADSVVKIWAWRNGGNGSSDGDDGDGEQQSAPQWACLATLQGHTHPITSLVAHPLAEDGGGSDGRSTGLLLASTSGGADIVIWHCNPAAAAAARDTPSSSSIDAITGLYGQATWGDPQRIAVGTKTALCADVAGIPSSGGWLLLATGCADGAVRLYARPPRGAFAPQCRLAGHENWVRSVAFARASEEDGPGGEGGREVLLLASAGQDRYARIWRIGRGASTLGAASSSGGGNGAVVSARANAAGTAAATGTVAAAAPPAGIGDVLAAGGLAAAISRYAPRPHVAAAGAQHWATLEALLVGHEDWVHGVAWRPAAAAAAAAVGGGAAGAAAPRRGELRLLTASQDRTMLVWRCEPKEGLWLAEASVGDAGASCLGYFGGAWAPSGGAIAAHGFTGALHAWDAAGGGGGGGWAPRHAVGGHFGPVVDVAFGADGRCVQSASEDQTARLFADVGGHWCELARTQVHGHDFSCLATIPLPPPSRGSTGSSGSSGSSGSGGGRSFMYASGSEEKVVRVFEAPTAFLDSLDAARGRARGATATRLGVARGGASGGLALGAAVGALALSNKAIHCVAAPDSGGGGAHDGSGFGGAEEAECPEGPDMLPQARPAPVDGPPLEEHLSQNTLWPEVRKLYGHGNDVAAAATRADGRLLASACRAQSAASAEVWVWEVGTWRALARLPAHALTVTQLAWSPRGGGYLLSGSRDRSFAVWRVRDGGGDSSSCPGSGGQAGQQQAAADQPSFELLARVKAGHARVIWGVSWAHDERCFATCSRDQTVKVWPMVAAAAAAEGKGHGEEPEALAPAAAPAATLRFDAAVTAVAFAPEHAYGHGRAGGGDGSYLLAAGLGVGSLQLWAVPRACCEPAGSGSNTDNGSSNGAAASPKLLFAVPAGQAHAAAVRRIAWAPPADDEDGGGGGGHQAVLLASCGDDHAVRVYEVEF